MNPNCHAPTSWHLIPKNKRRQQRLLPNISMAQNSVLMSADTVASGT